MIMNKSLIFVFAVIVISASTALAGVVQPSRFRVPEEDNPEFKRFVHIANENGEIELVDLALADTSDRATKAITTEDVTFYLFTKDNIDQAHVITNGQVSELSSSKFDSGKLSIFIVHGWNNNHESKINRLLTPALLARYDVNVFVVDWSPLANGLYLTGYSSVSEIGGLVANFINGIFTTYGTDGSSVVMIGHSLGAHVCGNAGAKLASKPEHIVGLDPASPLFTLGNTDNRIDPSDANFVQIIHTNGLLLGFASAIGDADYYPNGGMVQTGCGFDITGTCSHSRSYEYMAESLTRGDVFKGVLCNNYEEYVDFLCASNQVSFMGKFVVDEKAHGDFFMDTAAETPYGLS